MKKGFGLVPILVVVGVVVILGAVAVSAVNFTDSRKIDKTGSSKTDGNFGFLDTLEEKLTGQDGEPAKPVPAATPTPKPTVAPTPVPPAVGSLASTTYTQPQGIYLITLPPGWVMGSTFATSTYSTTTFSGSNGTISITFGTGKDPIGGCSEASAVVLADRTISGCYLLQQNGARILTRGYTKTSGNLPTTIEAYINPPQATNQPVITQIIGTIDIR